MPDWLVPEDEIHLLQRGILKVRMGTHFRMRIKK